MNPKVSIIIPVYNGANYMREAIDSALAQTYENIEIIVVNDGSNDDGATREIAISYGDRIRYFEKENGGVSTALNLGIREMKGDFFSWLSHDDVYHPDKVLFEIEALKKYGSYDIPVYCGWENLVMPENKVVSDKGNEERFDRKYFESGFFASFIGFISGCSLLIHKSFFDKYGGFDEKLRLTQDYAKWFEMFKDKRMIYVDKPLIRSRVHEKQVGNVTPGFHEACDELHLWMLENTDEDDLLLNGIDAYTFWGMAIIRLSNCGFNRAMKYAEDRLMKCNELPEHTAKREEFRRIINNSFGDDIYLYCMGQRGKTLINEFYCRGVRVNGFSDGNVDNRKINILDVKGVEPDEIPKNAAVFVTKDHPEDVMAYLKNKGFNKVYSYNCIEQMLMETPTDKECVKRIMVTKNLGI